MIRFGAFVVPLVLLGCGHIEHQADRFAIQLSGPDPSPQTREVAVRSFQKMAARNLSDPNPPALVEWWLYSHPSLGNRIRFSAGQ